MIFFFFSSEHGLKSATVSGPGRIFTHSEKKWKANCILEICIDFHRNPRIFLRMPNLYNSPPPFGVQNKASCSTYIERIYKSNLYNRFYTLSYIFFFFCCETYFSHIFLHSLPINSLNRIDEAAKNCRNTFFYNILIKSFVMWEKKTKKKKLPERVVKFKSA